MNINQEFQKLQESVEKEIQRLKAIADAQIQPPMQLHKYTGANNKEYQYAICRNCWGEADLSADVYFNQRSRRKPDVITEEFLDKVLAQWDAGVNAWKEDNQQTYLDNQAVIKHNTLQYDRVALIMKTLGVKDVVTKSYFKTARSTKMTHEKNPASWPSEVRAVLPMNCGYKDQLLKFDKKREEIKSYGERRIKEHTEKVRKEKIEADKLQKEQNKIKTVAYLAAKYNVGTQYDEESVLDEILNKCKYLYLAHYLLKNRSDWNDGYHYAEVGLSKFSIESDIDQEIYDDIQGIIDQDDVDGRYFRDMKYNYSVLFGMVDEDLSKDYQSIIEFAD